MKGRRSFAAVSLLVLGACGGEPADSGGSAGSPSHSGGSGGADAAPVLGEPIDVAPSEEWVWVPIAGTMCADGTEAGVGVNFTSQSSDLTIWFQGNGVCYDPTTCTLFEHELVGMGSDPLNHMWWGDPFTGRIGVFDRTDTANPLRASNFVVFPHCGVDGHTADKESTYPPRATIQQRGYRNVTVALERIVATFVDATRIVVAGFSAGGIGAKANYHQIATAFEAVGQPPPFLIDDAGPVLRPPYLGEEAMAKLESGWGLADTIEPWCPDCATEGHHAIYEALLRLHPGLRSAVVSSYADGVATPLYGLLNGGTFDGARFEEGLRDLAGWSASFQDEVAPSAMREFYYPGTRHGALVVGALGATPGLVEFLDAQLDGSASWTSVVP